MKNTTGPNPMSDARPGHREIRSFVLREGRLTRAQARALEELWPVYGLDNGEHPIGSPFGNEQSPIHVEIGFGNGDSLVQLAAEDPSADFLGVEVHDPGIGHCMIAARAAGVENLKLIAHDAIEVLEHTLPPESLQRINLYFPDPWPKKRHHKRRIRPDDEGQDRQLRLPSRRKGQQSLHPRGEAEGIDRLDKDHRQHDQVA